MSDLTTALKPRYTIRQTAEGRYEVIEPHGSRDGGAMLLGTFDCVPDAVERINVGGLISHADQEHGRVVINLFDPPTHKSPGVSVQEVSKHMVAPRVPLVLPDWFSTINMQQQSVLLLATRGPDGFPKRFGIKPVLRAYRGFVLKAAYYGREIRHDDPGSDSFMRLDRFYSAELWAEDVKEFFTVTDALNVHFYTHLTYGIQILGYKHPDAFVRSEWHKLYLMICDDNHHPPETEEQMDARLSDWNREFWN